MGNSFESIGGGFAGDTGETQAPEYRTILKSSVAEDQYLSTMQEIGGLKNKKWRNRIINYYRKNDNIIDPSQDGLNYYELKTIFNQYPDHLEENNSLNERSIKPDQSEDGLDNILNIYFPEDTVMPVTEETGVSNIFDPELSPEQQAEIEARKANYQYPIRIARDGDYVRGMTLPEWLQIEEGSSEHATLINGIKTNGIMPSLGKLDSNIKDQKANNDISGEYLAFINATREFYGLAPYGSISEELVEENPTAEYDSATVDSELEVISEVTEARGDNASLAEQPKPEAETPNLEVVEEQDEESPLENEELLNLPETEALQAELDRLIEVEAAKLQKEEIVENLSYKVDREKLDRFKDNARQAISNYQQFVRDHSSLADKSNPQIQERYQLLEKYAWNSLYSLAHLLDGEIATLPQDRDIQLSHPEGVDTRQYLEARGYKFDENGDITHITNKGVEIELNRAMKTESLIKSRRPSHVVYPNPLRSSLISNDISEGFQRNVSIGTNSSDRSWARPIQNDIDLDRNQDVSRPKYYHSYLTKGYIVRGLNQQTPDFIIGVLDKNNLEPVIVDETIQPNKTSEGVQDPWSEEVKGETEFDKIFADSLKYNNETQISDEMSDPWVEKSVIEEPPIMPVFPIPSGDNPDLQSEGAYPLGEEGLEATPKVSLDDLRLAYAKAEEAYNRKRGDWDLEDAFLSAREVYNTELERVLKLKVAEGQESSIHDLFKKEVIDLREERITQSQELQGTWEKKLNPIKEKFVNFIIKNKKFISRLNLAAGVAGGALALTGVGIPLAGGLAVTRRAISGVMLGVSSGEGIRGLGEDTDINWFGGRVKFKAVIPKLVQESLASSEDKFKKVNDDVLKDRLGTLEAYYRLNGGKFTNDDQQKAYEKVLTELGNRVKVNTIENYQNENTSNVEVQQDSVIEQDNQDTNSTEQFNSRESRYYVSGMLNTISDTRIAELDKFRRKRKIATGAGIAVGLLAGGAVHIFDEVNKPDSVDLKDGPGAGPGGTGAPEAGAGVTKTIPDASPAGTGAEATEALRQQAAAATNEAREVLAQDVSNLDSGETIWGEIAKQLGPDASQGQIQQAVENYLQSQVGQESIFKLAQQTEGGRELLSQLGVDNAGEMVGLSKEQLDEVSKYLGEGKLDGLTELSLDNLDALEQAEYVAPSPTEAPTIEPGSTEAPPAGTEDIVSKPPAPLYPPVTEAPGAPPNSEVSPVASTEFTKGVSEALGTTNLTDSQIGSILEAYADTDQGRESLYNLIITSEANNPAVSDLLTEYNVIDIYDFADLSDSQLNILAQTVGVENLDKLPGFELNEIILSKFEDAPDMVELVKGSKPLDIVNRYIASEVGNLPYDASLGQQILNTYLETPQGKQWLYDAIIINNPDKLNGNQNIQFVEEYFRQKGIKSGADINWLDLTQDRRFPTSIFWRETVLAGGRRIPPLSTLLQPSKMPGIKDALRQVLTRQ